MMPHRTLDEFLALDDKNLKKDLQQRREKNVHEMMQLTEYF